MAVKIKATEVSHGASWDQTTISEVELDELDVALSEMEQAKAKLEHAQLAFALAQDRVIDMMEQRAEKTHVSALDGGRQATVVRSDQVLYDDEAILAALDADQVTAVTRLKLERKKVEAEVLAGRIDARLIAEHATVLPRKPFIKVSEVREQEPAE